MLLHLAYPNMYRFNDEVFGELSLALSSQIRMVIWKISDDQKLVADTELRASRWEPFETILVKYRIPIAMKFSNWDAFGRMLDAVCTGTLFSRLLQSGRLSLAHKSYRLDTKWSFERWKPNVLKLRGHEINLKPSQLFELLEVYHENAARHVYVHKLLQAELDTISGPDQGPA